MKSMKKKHTNYGTALVAALMAGGLWVTSACTSPKVITDVVMKYPPSVVADSVIVCEPGDSVPADAMRLGRVAVVDDGLSHRCKYHQVLALAKGETARVGGNVLRIVEHQKPSVWKSTCHQIYGEMLLTGKIDVDSVDFVSYARAALENEERQFEEYTVRRLPPNRIRIDGGMGWNIDKLKTTHGNYSPHIGWTGRVAYEHFFAGITSVGATYVRTTGDYSHLGRFWMDYAGATLGMGYRFKEHTSWLWTMQIGLGVANYHIDNFHSHAGPGLNFGGGIDWMLTHHIAIGMDAGFVMGTFSKPDEVVVSNERGKSLDIGTFMLQGGLRFYF